jgi:hypothetical protein
MAQGPGSGQGKGMGMQGQGMGPGGGMGPGHGMGPGGKCMMMGAGQGPGPGKGPGMMDYCWGRERMFGTRLMSLEERQAHMTKMWNAKSVEERNKIREEHRKLMLERAKQQQQTIDEKSDDTFSVPERK